MYAYAAEADRKRIVFTENRMLCNTYEARIAKRREKKKSDELNQQTEAIVYASGEF